MITPSERIEVFKDTMDWIEKDPVLSEYVSVAKQNTTVFYENIYPEYDKSKTYDMAISVTQERSFKAVMRLSKEYPGSRIAVMNFANAFRPGGGVKQGSDVQEESLCRISTLYPLISQKNIRESFYQHHMEMNTPRASDSLIYSEGVIICKSDKEYPERLSKGEWVKVDVMTIAAPDLREEKMCDAELFGYHVKRAIHMFTCAAAKEADILVLGAFGCGAFRNNPEVVAKAYLVALQEFPEVFRKIEFAVYCPPGSSDNYNVFKEVFCGLTENDRSRDILHPRRVATWLCGGKAAD